MRIALMIEYDGSRFSGWQLQPEENSAVRTVQGAIEQALSVVADAPVRVTVAGRTDAGVHACGQVVHFDTTAIRSSRAWLRGGNSNLPDDVVVLWANEVAPEFHARFSATGRRYRYVILNRPVRPTFARERVTWEYRPLDIARMQEGADHLVGTHDFSSYRAVECQAKSPVREMRALEVSRHGDLVVVDAYANAFLHHMVRNIAGVLLAIGAGQRDPEWAQEVLEARDRTVGGITAPPHGLYLTEVEYPEVFGIPGGRPSGCGTFS